MDNRNRQRLFQVFISIGLGLLLSFKGFAAAPAKAENASKPNIIIIMSDDVGYSDIGAFGGEIRTPEIDSLASNGRKFTQFYNTSRCCPTRASLLTGLYPHQTGIGHMIFDTPHPGYSRTLAPDAIMLAEVLQEAGYGTYLTGKWHLAPRGSDPEDIQYWPTRRGFDKFYGTIAGYGNYWNPRTLCRGETLITPENDPEYKPDTFYYTDAINDNAISFLKQHEEEKGDQPFFLYISHTAGHWPLHAPEEEIDAYDGVYDEGYEAIHQQRVNRLRELNLVPEVNNIAKPVGNWDSVENKDIEASLMETYAAMITRMDKGIGNVMDHLKKTGQFDNTIVFYFQDNGGCAVDWFRTDYEHRENYEPMEPNELQTRSIFSGPLQTRDGRPVRMGHDIKPGPENTYVGYKENWANVSNAPFQKYKRYVHEGGISSPLIVHWPERIAPDGSEPLIREPTHVIDIMPTCLEAAGVEVPDKRKGVKVQPVEGVSLMPVLTESGSLDRGEPIFFEHESNRAVRDGKWKLVALEGEPWSLYDMSKDRGETNNLAETYPNTVARLAAEWYSWAERSRVLPVGGWMDRVGETTLHLAQRDSLAPEESPLLKKSGFDLQVRVLKGPANGVLLAQGDNQNGFSLYLKNNILHLAMRRNGELEHLELDYLPEPPFTVIAGINRRGRAKLGIDDHRMLNFFSGGLQENPKEGLSVGFDSLSPVGEYNSEFPFEGKLGFVDVRGEID